MVAVMGAWTAVARVLPMGLVSCSWMASVRPPADYRPGPDPVPECSEGLGSPIADTVGAGIGVATAFFGLILFSDPTLGRGGSVDPVGKAIAQGYGTIFMAGGVAIAAPYALSASYGYDASSDCRSFKQKLAARKQPGGADWLEERAQRWASDRAAQTTRAPGAGQAEQECRLGKQLGVLECEFGLVCVGARCQPR